MTLESSRRWRYKQRRLGLCISCTEKVVSGNISCKEHLRKTMLANREKRKKLKGKKNKEVK